MEREGYFGKGLVFFTICFVVIVFVVMTISIYSEIGWYVFLIEGGIGIIFLLAKPMGKLITKIQQDTHR